MTRKKIQNAICIAAAGILTIAVYWRFRFLTTEQHVAGDTVNKSSLCTLAGLSGKVSTGFDAGKILSIDGKPVAELASGKNGWEKYCALPGFNLIGSSGSGGAVKEWRDVLWTADAESRVGADIQTTISYDGNLKATELLSRYFPKDVCSSAALAVVLRDGAVLVNAGSNLCTTEDYFSDAIQPRIHENFATAPYQCGSIVKPLMSRVLLLHDNELPAEWSVQNNAYTDVSFYSPAAGITIHNHDYNNAAAYTGTSGTCYTRKLSLYDAHRVSSNTYFLAHMLFLGGGAVPAYKLFSDCYASQMPIQTDLDTLSPVVCTEEKLYWWFWGQSFECSVTRICQMFNHALSGDAYTPFYTAGVFLDGEQIYEADPQPRTDLSFDVPKNDLLKDVLADCFSSYTIDPAITAPYQEYIRCGRLLSKSGTSDTDISRGLINAARTLTVLDEDNNVICTACILVHNIRSGSANNDTLYSILFDTLSAAGVLESDLTVIR